MRRDQRRAVGADAHVERERQPLGAELLEPRRDELGIADGEAADRRRASATPSACSRLARVADSAAELHVRCRPRSRMRRISGRFTGSPRFGAVEIDDVQPAGAELAVLLRELDGIDGVTRLLREVAFEQADAAPVTQVDGRYQLHYIS